MMSKYEIARAMVKYDPRIDYSEVASSFLEYNAQKFSGGLLNET